MSSESGVLRRVPCDTWEIALTSLASMKCYWADLDGLHLEDAPKTLPIATHLWAFNGTDRWARLRIEQNVIHFVALETSAASIAESTGGADRNLCAVDYKRVTQKTWQPQDRRVLQANLSGIPAEVEVIEVVGLSPLTFISVR